MYTQNKVKQSGLVTFHSLNCNNKIRACKENKFEKVTLLGKHAFKYSVITENKVTNELKQITFPTRKEALCFFMLSVKKYD